MSKDFGIYVHIPFCDSKCSYCNFVSGVYDNEVKNSYFKALKNEIMLDCFLSRNSAVTSIYFGGGTPSSVDSKNIISILNVLKKSFKIDKNAEISIECNPCSVDFKKLSDYKKAGFTRISFGAQSFDDEVLNFLNRRHCFTQIFDAIQIAKKVGFENISIDLIIGVKKTDFLNFEQNVSKLKNMGLKHISVYMLMLESGTKLFTEYQNNIFEPLSDDECVFEYNKILKILKNLGFYRYEISNFALKNFECKHNQNYWNCGEYLGFGVASHSFIKGKRIETTSKIFEYINHFNELNEKNKFNKLNELNRHKKLKKFDKLNQLNKSNKLNKLNKFNSEKNEFNVAKQGKNSIYAIEMLTKNQKIEEYIMLALRMKRGLLFSKLKQLGFDIEKEKANELKKLIERELVIKTKSRLFVSEKHFGTLNPIILKLIP